MTTFRVEWIKCSTSTHLMFSVMIIVLFHTVKLYTVWSTVNMAQCCVIMTPERRYLKI